MSTIYRLHLAETPKGNLKYGWLRSLIGPPSFLDLERRIVQNPGESAQSYWPNDFQVEYVYKNKKRGDLATAGPYLILSTRAADVLRDLLEPNGEFLPVVFPENPDVALFHPTTALDALDKEKAELRYMDLEKKKPFKVVRYWFVEEKLGDVPIFVLAEDAGKIFVADAFVERVCENQPTGFGFRRLWSPELGSVRCDRWQGPFPASEDINL